MHESASAALGTETVLMAAADFPVYFAFIFDDVPGDGQHPMGNGSNGRILSSYLSRFYGRSSALIARRSSMAR